MVYFCEIAPSLFWWEFWAIIVVNLGFGIFVDRRLLKDAVSMKPVLPTFSSHGYGAVVYYISFGVFIITFFFAVTLCN